MNEQIVGAVQGRARWPIIISGAISAVIVGSAVYWFQETKVTTLETEKQSFIQENTEVTQQLSEVQKKLETSCTSQAETNGGLELPQVYYIAKAYYTAEDIQMLENNVLEPLIKYYESIGQTVVSIEIDNDKRGSDQKSQFTISAIISNRDGDSMPVYYGFIWDKVDGNIPVWDPLLQLGDDDYQG